MNSERDQINYAKGELRQFMFLLKEKYKLDGELLKCTTALRGVKSPNGTILVGTGDNEKEYRKQDLRDKIDKLKDEIWSISVRTDKVQTFLNSLDDTERRIVADIYIKGRTIERTATWVYCSEKTLKRRIKDIMSNF